jgi:uncharacterized membrane protein YgcG
MNRIFFIISCLLILPGGVVADERILSFHSDIHILEDGSMKVTETITVRAEGKNIKRGIYRDFPTTYRDRLGNRYNVGFTVDSVIRGGQPEDYYTKSHSNGVRIYFGSKDKLLRTGEHTYSLVYTTNRQLGFFEKYDELYWNVTGNGWDFPIDKAGTEIHLPKGVSFSDLSAEAYTGLAGSKEQTFVTGRANRESIRIEAARPLLKREGLTIVLGWPKGIIAAPTTYDQFIYVLEDNRHILVACLGLLLLTCYYLLVWMKFGKDPEKDVIVAKYEPPEGYSPAAIRYIEEMRYDKTCFAAAIINLAVKGYLTISEADDKYILKKTGDKVDMAAGEKRLVARLFRDGRTIVLEQDNHERISDAMDVHKESLKLNYEKEYFLTNRTLTFVGLGITLCILFATLYTQPERFQFAEALFMIVWLTGWTAAVLALASNTIHLWRKAHNSKSVFAALVATAFATPFLMGLIFFAKLTSWSVAIILLVAVAVNWTFYELLKAPTLLGRKLLDKVEGFRRYIDIAERHELDYKHPKGRCPELFEKYLPFALAMGIEQKWGEQFADVLVKTQASGGANYHPSWYSGSQWNNYHIGDFSSSLGSSFTNAIASSSTAPGSSSGGGGGGFSGGGGGGGGGGGW